MKRVEVVLQAPRSKEEIIDGFSDVFTGLSCMEGEYHIKLDDSVQPVIQTPRRVPHSLHDKLKVKLQEKEKNGVIQKVDKPTEWVDIVVTVEKRDGSLRLCLDPGYLNKAICGERPPGIVTAYLLYF